MEQPVDLTSIAGALGRAKKIMSDELPSSQSNHKPSVNESTEKEMPSMVYKSKTSTSKRAPKLSQDAIMNSKLPPEIRESLLNDPNDMDFNDVADANVDSVLETINNIAGEGHHKQPINETPIVPERNTINESQIRGIVKEELMEFFSKEMVKMVAEQIIGKLKKKK